MDSLVVIVMGSKSDLEWARGIGEALEQFGVPHIFRVASAHKGPAQLLGLIDEYDQAGRRLVYIAVAGRSNALGGMLDANTTAPVINCPPYSERYAGLDILSSLRMPSGVAASTVLEVEAAALAAVKILALQDEALRKRLAQYQATLRSRMEADDRSLREVGKP